MTNNRYWQIFFILLFFINSSFAKNYITKKLPITKAYINKTSFFQVVRLQEILNRNPQIKYRKIADTVYFNYPEFSIASNFPNKGYFDKLFILNIPNGRVQGEYGHVFINNEMPEELVWSQRYFFLNNISKISENNIKKVNGKVAVIAQFGHGNYFHWINEILGRLAILEMANIEYDWLYVPYKMNYAKEILQLWGIDSSKIISPDGPSFCLQADELIVPSLVNNTTVGHSHAGTFIHPATMNYVKEKLLKAVLGHSEINTNDLPKKIFISRKDSYAVRKILNEDEIFEFFEAQGFVRYELSKLSVVEQIILFSNAEIIVSEQGSGLANILFCKPKTKVIELFQAMIDNCFWWQSSILNLEYMPFLTIPVNEHIFAQCDFGKLYHQAWLSQINIPLEPIKKIIKDLEKRQ